LLGIPTPHLELVILRWAHKDQIFQLPSFVSRNFLKFKKAVVIHKMNQHQMKNLLRKSFNMHSKANLLQKKKWINLLKEPFSNLITLIANGVRLALDSSSFILDQENTNPRLRFFPFDLAHPKYEISHKQYHTNVFNPSFLDQKTLKEFLEFDAFHYLVKPIVWMLNEPEFDIDTDTLAHDITKQLLVEFFG
jgi:hypothetical protein